MQGYSFTFISILLASIFSSNTLAQKTTDYRLDFLPVIQKHCFDCHEGEDAEDDINLASMPTFDGAIRRLDLWERALEAITEGRMPPKSHDTRPNAEEIAKLKGWIHHANQRIETGKINRDPGRVPLRRLSRNEYNYTVRDLFGIQFKAGKDFPSEGGSGGFDNSADGLFTTPIHVENYVLAAGQVMNAIFKSRSLKSRVIFTRPKANEDPTTAAYKIIDYYTPLAYRRPATGQERRVLFKLFEESMRKTGDFDTAIRTALKGMLLSPKFLYRSEADQVGKTTYAISEFERASRLSYFLWSSMPDRELFQAAAKGGLERASILYEQVDRMLNSPKSRSLAMHFAGQWLGWDGLREKIEPDQNRYPEFTKQLRYSMYLESVEFFDHLIRTDGSVLDLIHSDYTFLNETLAKHYGIPGVKGEKLQKVKLTDPNRGGVLGMGSVLTATSLPLRTSPVLRGNYVLTQLVGRPVSPPPMNVPQLPADDKTVGGLTFRQQLEAHQDDPACAGCHSKIDPIGFGLENFDPIGRWRTELYGKPIDSRGALPNGDTFQSPVDLKKIIYKNRMLFLRKMAERMLVYALGRPLEFYDRHTVNRIAERVANSKYRIRAMIFEVAKSYPFNYRRNNPIQQF